MKKIIVSVIILIILVVVCLIFLRETPFTYSGVMEAVEINIPSRINDTLAQINVDEGDIINKGQLLAKFDCQDISLKQEIAQKEFDRAQVLLKTSAGSKENFDLKKHSYDQASLYKDWCNIFSPINGKILYKYYEEQEFVPVGKKIFTVADLSKIDAWVYVEHDLLASIAIGQKVTGYLPEINKTFEGTILTINDEAEFTPKNVQTRKERQRLVFGVKTRFLNDENLTLKPGMTLEVKF